MASVFLLKINFKDKEYYVTSKDTFTKYLTKLGETKIKLPLLPETCSVASVSINNKFQRVSNGVYEKR